MATVPQNTLLLVGGDLCERTAAALDGNRWQCIGLRRRPMPAAAGPARPFGHAATKGDAGGDPPRAAGSQAGKPPARILWRQADLRDAASLGFLADAALPSITHILYAPAPDGRGAAPYQAVYGTGLRTLLGALPPAIMHSLQRCVLVGSSAVWGPRAEWVDEDTPPDATDFRARALLDAEQTLQRWLPPGRRVALRLSGLYGPGRERLLQGLRAGTIAAPDGPGHWANRIHIDDAARACAHLLACADPAPLYIGTDDRPIETAALYDALAALAGGPAPPRVARPPSGKRLSNARLRASGWAPRWSEARQGYAALLSRA